MFAQPIFFELLPVMIAALTWPSHSDNWSYSHSHGGSRSLSRSHSPPCHPCHLSHPSHPCHSSLPGYRVTRVTPAPLSPLSPLSTLFFVLVPPHQCYQCLPVILSLCWLEATLSQPIRSVLGSRCDRLFSAQPLCTDLGSRPFWPQHFCSHVGSTYP